MSLEAARRWLEQHRKPLPAQALRVQALHQAIEEKAPLDQLLEILQPDPALVASLLARVNSRRRNEPIESLAAAASLIGEPALVEMLRQHPAADNRETDFLHQQLLDRSHHNMRQVIRCAEQLGYGDLDSLGTAARLMYIGELHCCLLEPKRYLDVWRLSTEPGADEDVFGFEFSELGQLIAEQEHLPERVALAQPHHQGRDAKTRLLRLTTRLCRHCEWGWRDERVTADLQQLAELMQQPIDRIAKEVHQTAVEAARSSPFADAWYPASRLPLIKDSVWQPPSKKVAPAPSAQTEARQTRPPPVPEPPVRGSATRDRLQTLLRDPTSTQSQLLQTCLQGLHEELGFTRVSLFLLSRDRKLLQNRLAIGLDPEAPLRRYSVDTARAGLLGQLMKKPQALRLTVANWTKYESLIPPSLLARLDTRDFVAMSLFIAGKPIGVVLADRKGDRPIEAEDFAVFKQVVDLCSRALTLLARRN